jgi:hypothetical protein
MKKQFEAILTATAVFSVITAIMLYLLTPVQPHHYELHYVRGGESLHSIILDANKGGDITFDVREAAAKAVAESKKMEGGVQGDTIFPGEKVAVPIYK